MGEALLGLSDATVHRIVVEMLRSRRLIGSSPSGRLVYAESQTHGKVEPKKSGTELYCTHLLSTDIRIGVIALQSQ